MDNTKRGTHFYGKVDNVFIAKTITIILQNGEEHTLPFLAPPALPQGLVGRDDLLLDLKKQLLKGGSSALSALNGLPGVGKTAIAVNLAWDREIQEHFSDGVLWAGLGRWGDVLSHLGTWATAVGVPSDKLTRLTTIEARANAIHAAIGMRRMLLVVDDAWQVEAALAFKLGGPNCAHLVTTRLHEVALRFAGDGTVNVHELSEAQGLELLTNLAPEVVKHEPGEARALVRAVGGLPLAIILMGNYLRMQTHGEQSRRLRAALERLQKVEERLRLEQSQGPLEGHPSLPPNTPLSLLAVIGISYEALDEASRHSLRALSVFPPKPNTFSEQAALAICAESQGTLDKLYDYGILESGGEDRYTLHQTIADYAKMKLTDETVYERMVDFSVQYVETHKKDYDILDKEIENVRTALEIASEREMHAPLVRVTNGFFYHMENRGLYTMAEDYLNKAWLVVKFSDNKAELVTVLLNMGRIANNSGNYDKAEKYLKESLDIAREIGNREKISTMLSNLAEVASHRGNYDKAEKYLKESLDIAREIGNRERMCTQLSNLGAMAGMRGDYVQSEEYLLDALEMAYEIDDNERISFTLINLGGLENIRGNHAQAEEYLLEALEVTRKVGNKERLGALFVNLGGLTSNRSDYDEAEEYLKEGLEIARETGHKENISHLIGNLGSVARKRGDYDKAEEYLKEGLEIAREIGHKENISYVLAKLGELARDLGNYDEAEKYLKESLDIARKINYKERLIAPLTNIGGLAREFGDYDKAKKYLKEALNLAREIGQRLLITVVLCEWGEYHLGKQKLDSASANFSESLEIARKVDSQEYIAISLYGLARIASAQGDIAEARRHGKESLKILEIIGHIKAIEIRQWLDNL